MATTGRAQVFISYRRQDTAGHAGHLYSDLRERFDVFMDIDDIPPGSDFPAVISSALADCDVIMVLIGNEWVTAADAKGRRRLRKPNDLVRLEVETGLERGIALIPVLVDRADMPSPEQLPPSIRPLTRRNAFEISNRRWDADMDELIAAIEAVTGEGGSAPPVEPLTTSASTSPSRVEPVPPPPPPRPAVPASSPTPSRQPLLIGAAIAAVAAVAVIIAVIVLAGGDDGSEQTEGTEAVNPPVERDVSVPGTDLWTNTGVQVDSGQTVRVTATGTVQSAQTPPASNGPDGLTHLEGFPDTRTFESNVISGEYHAALIGRIGVNGTPFLLGADQSFTSATSGVLYLGVNDTGVDNNSGGFQARVTVEG